MDTAHRRQKRSLTCLRLALFFIVLGAAYRAIAKQRPLIIIQQLLLSNGFAPR